uniref:Uncharacterized protein n=1 Tax=Arundo donax TaxID=35708 RepID=A0A0A8ZF60_ARUDO
MDGVNTVHTFEHLRSDRTACNLYALICHPNPIKIARK